MHLPLSKDLFLGRPRFPGGSTSTGAQAWNHFLSTPAAPSRLSAVGGDFAVGTTRPDGSTFLATDRFAMQTLCYRVNGKDIAFAEKADQLVGPNPELDPQALFDYLYFHVIPSPRTAFKDVLRLPPGRCAEFRQGQLKIAPYWEPRFTEPAKPVFDDLKAEFLELLKTAVKRQMDGSKAACFLSGGTDSSTVTGMLAQLSEQGGGQQACAYSIGFEADGYDEMEYARIAARRFGVEHNEYYVTPDDLVRSMGHVAASFDQPFGNSSVVPAYYCAMQARQNGVTRILAGDGGDELFGGNTRYAKQELFAYYQQVPGFLRKGLLEPLFKNSLMAQVPLLGKGSRYIGQATTPLPERLQDSNLVKRLGYGNVLEPGFLAAVDTQRVGAEQAAVWAEGRSRNEVDLHLAYDWRYTLAEADLPKVRGSSSLAGLATGFPMLDDDLLAFSMRLPASYKLKDRQLRWFFKEALRGFLPDQIITKKKQGFGLPYGVWVMRHQGLRDMAVDSMRSFGTRGIVRPQFIKELMEQRMPEHPHYYGTMVWILVMAEQWMRVHSPNYRLR